MDGRKLRRVTDAKHQWFAGVCAGVAYWLGVPIWIVRVLWVICTLVSPYSAAPYILLAIFLPAWDRAPDDLLDVTGD